MMLRLALLILGWSAVVLGAVYAVWRIWLGFDQAIRLARGVDAEHVMWVLTAALTPAVFVSGLGTLMLMLASLDRRLERLERKP